MRILIAIIALAISLAGCAPSREHRMHVAQQAANIKAMAQALRIDGAPVHMLADGIERAADVQLELENARYREARK